MDSLTHSVIGICVGDAVAGKKMGKRAMFWGAVINNLPDIDVFTSLWMSQADSLLAHRGFTHSILFAVVMTPLVAEILFRSYRRTGITRKDWLLLTGSGLFTHFFIDAFTAYGTAWYEPFDHHRVSFNLLFVADFLYTLPFLVSALFLLFLHQDHPRRKRWQRLAIGLNAVYLLFCLWNKAEIDRSARKAFAEQGISVRDYFTTPTPLNNLLWYIVGKSDSGCYIGYRSVLDSGVISPLTFFPTRDSLLIPFRQKEEVTSLIRFSEGYYTLSQDGAEVEWNDLRFGQVDGWSDPYSPFVFRYRISGTGDNDLVIQRGRMQAFSDGGWKRLWRRMWGNTSIPLH